MNDTESSSVVRRVLELIENHVELGTLECRYESSRVRRQICAIAVGAAFGLAAFVFLQVALIQGLLCIGFPLWAFCLLAAAFYGTLAVMIYRLWGRRQPEAGSPFQASGEEFKRSLQWIRENLS